MKKFLLFFIKIICVLLILVSLIQIIRISTNKKHYNKKIDTVKKYITSISPTTDTEPTPSESNQNNVTITPGAAITYIAPITPEVLPDYISVYGLNSDFSGWIKIDNTVIDYPVMQCKDDPDFYLHSDFYKSEDKHGSIYIDAGCDILESDNLILYGHNMMDGTMFADLNNFRSADFCNAAHDINFDTLYEKATYQVILVFKISANEISDFPYHTYSNFSKSHITANEYLDMCTPYMIWRSNKSIDDNSSLLTLSTCEYSLDNGRLVIIAAKMQ